MKGCIVQYNYLPWSKLRHKNFLKPKVKYFSVAGAIERERRTNFTLVYAGYDIQPIICLATLFTLHGRSYF